jgi:predicted small lipoprotein YifL
VRRLIFITGALLISLAACRGPLAKPEAAEAVSEAKTENQPQSGMAHMADAKAAKVDIKIEPSEGITTLSDLFSNKKNYSGKTVKVKGKITKVNPSIMGKNWIHIQDGTSFEDQYDLTVTSDFIPQVGSIIKVEGKISLDKDFGYGYTYPVLMEEGKLIQ